MKIEITNRAIFTLILVIVLFISAYAVSSYDAANIPNPGHGAEEILIEIHGEDKILQQAITDGDLGSWIRSGNDIVTYMPGKFGVGVIPSYDLDANGKIRIRSPILDTDNSDTVVTKGYFDDNKIVLGSCPDGQAVTGVSPSGLVCARI